MKKLLQIKARAFTLVEMLVVLIIISILLLLFVPNLSKQKEAVQETGAAALVKVVESQAELFELNHEGAVTLTKLVESEAISPEQAQSYKEYYAKHTNKMPAVAP